MVVHFFYMLKGIFRRFAIHGCTDSVNSVPDSGTGKLFKVKWGRFSDIMLSAQPFAYFTMALELCRAILRRCSYNYLMLRPLSALSGSTVVLSLYIGIPFSIFD